MKQTRSRNFTNSPTLVENLESGDKLFRDWEDKQFVLYRDGRFLKVKRLDSKEPHWAKSKRWLTERDFLNYYASCVEIVREKEEKKIPEIKYKPGYERRMDDEFVYIIKKEEDGSETVVKKLKRKVKESRGENLKWVKEGVEQRRQQRKKKQARKATKSK